jgi:hypothetical protein
MLASLLPLLVLGNGVVGLVVKRFPSSTYQLKEHHHAPRSWSRVGAAPPDHIITLRIGLTQGRFAELEKSLYEGTKIPKNLVYFQPWRLQTFIFCGTVLSAINC